MKHIYAIITLTGAVSICSVNAATITLQGAVGTATFLAVTPAVGYNTLDLGIDQTTDLKVATVNEKSNKHNGYSVTLASAGAVSKGGGTAAKLVGALSTPESLTYNMKYNGNVVTLVGGVATVTDASVKTLGTGVDKDLSITYRGASANLAADTYSDTLTLTIAAK